jgi:hypothetical protein
VNKKTSCCSVREESSLLSTVFACFEINYKQLELLTKAKVVRPATYFIPYSSARSNCVAIIYERVGLMKSLSG